jgi:hypothetical protein
MNPRLRTAVVLVVGLAALSFAADALVRSPAFLMPRDFTEYWSAGAVNLRGGNPYDPAQLLPLQQLADPGRTDTVMMWNPPWSLAVYMPLGRLGPRWATLLWVVLQLAAVMLACDLLWRTFDGPPRRRWVAQVAGLTFVGTWWLVNFGQNTGLILLGLAGFAFYWKRDRPAAAGAFAALTALKPQLLAVFGVLLVLGVVTRKGRVAVAAGGAVLAAALGLVLLANPDVVTQYRAAVRDPGPGAIPLHGWMLPTASYWIRWRIDLEQFWIQFVPCAAACLGYAAYRLWRGRTWDWPAELPAVVWVSVLTTAYGGWIFDLPVLLVPLVAVTARAVRGGHGDALVFLALGQVTILVVSLAWVYDLHQFWWVAPAVLAVHLGAEVLIRRPLARSLP